MQARSALDFVKYGVCITTIAAGIVLSVTHTKWALPPVVVIGSLGTVAFILLRRDDVGIRQGIDSAMHELAPALALALLVMSVLAVVGTGVVLIDSTRPIQVEPCLCPGSSGMRSLLTLMLGAGIMTFLQSACLLVMYIGILRLSRRRLDN